MQKFNQIGVFVVFVSSCSCSCFSLKNSKNIVRRSICVCKIGKILCVRNSKIHTVCKTFFFQKINKFICFTWVRETSLFRETAKVLFARESCARNDVNLSTVLFTVCPSEM